MPKVSKTQSKIQRKCTSILHWWLFCIEDNLQVELPECLYTLVNGYYLTSETRLEFEEFQEMKMILQKYF